MDFDQDLDLEAADAPVSGSGKLRKSCEMCRTSKGKCCPSNDDSRCQRCVKEEKECIFLRAKPRPKRSKNSRTRVTEMEQKLDSLYELLSTRNKVSSEATPPPMITLPEVQPAFSFEKTPPFLQSPLQTTNRRVAQFPIFALPFLAFDDIQDVISKGVVSLDRAQRSLDFFRTKASNFPFVYVPPDLSLDKIRREKPFLLHSILTCGAQSNLRLQTTLELELRESLSKKILIEGEKSMDLLQGLLVYLTWYHLYFNPENQQVYQLSQMTATMAVDLSIHRRRLDVNSRNKFPFVVESTLSSPWDEVERMRTFVGCYYTSSTISTTLRRPNLLVYNEYVEECCRVLAGAGYTETDYLIPHFIHLQRVAEEVSQAFDYDKAFQYPQLDPARVGRLSKGFQQQLEQLGQTFPPEVWDNVTIAMAYQTNKIYLHEVGFHSSIPNHFDSASSYRRWYFSSARSDALFACLQATKESLDRLLSLPSQELLSFTMYDFIRLIYTVLVLGRFSTGCDSPNLDRTESQSQASFEPYIVRLITMTEPLITVSEGEDRIDYMWHVRRLFQVSKVWIDQFSTGLPLTGLESELCYMDVLPSFDVYKVVDLSVSKYGCATEDGGICTTLTELSTYVDPSLVMLAENSL